MNKMIKDAIMVAAAGTAGYYAYKFMSPGAKRQISRDIKRTAEDMGNIKDDVSHMATTIKDTF